jgi:stigma-specific protein Stig1
MRLRALGWVGALALGACSSGYFVDQEEVCRRDSNAPGCPGPGGAAGASGLAGGGAGPGGASGNAGAGGSAGLGGGGTGGNGGSGGLVCEVPKVDCGGTCIDVTADDAEHCGACDYACGTGSTCTNGVCSPVAIASGVVAPYAFTLDAQNLYFVVPVKGPGDAVPPAVQKVARSGGSATSVFAGSIFRSRSLALLGTTLFFGDLDNGGQLVRGETSGGFVQGHTTEAQPAIQQLVAADGRLWWSTFTGNSRLRRALATGTPSAAEELLPLPTNAQFGRIPALTVGGTGAATTAYWVNAGGDIATDKGLWRKAGSADPVKLVPGGAMVTLALSGAEVFVADMTAGIVRVAANATAPATVTPAVPAAEVGGQMQGLTLANDKLYWLTFNAGQLELHRSGLDGSGARVLGRVAAKSAAYWGAPIGPAQLTVDGGFVYFSDPGTVTDINQQNPTLGEARGAADGAIYRLPE